MARRLQLSGIACLQCECRLLPSTTGQRFSRLASVSSTQPSTQPSKGLLPAQQQQTRGFGAARHLHKGGISLGTKAEALAAGSGSNNNNNSNNSNNKADVVADVVVDEVLLDDDLVDEPLLDERVSKAAAEAIWTSLLGDEGEPTESDIAQYIDELRPVDDMVLPRTVYDDLAHRLGEGFTTAQLLAYVRKHRKTTTPPTVYAWEERRRPWVPGTAARGESKIKAIGPGSALLLQGYVHGGMTNKDKIVAQLLRECWGVAVTEVMEAPGQLAVAVRPTEYALLAGGAQSWLRDIATAFSTVTTTKATASKSSSRSTSKGRSRRNRRIELSPEKRVLRIYAPASVADAMMAEIDRVLQGAVTKRFRLRDVARPGVVISSDAYKAVGALTGSWVRCDDDSNKKNKKGGGDVLVSWVTPSWVTPKAQAGKATVEDTGDVVFRLLLHTFGPAASSASATDDDAGTSANTTHSLDYRPLKKSKGRFLESENNGIHRAKLGWHDQLSKWARWIEPMPEARASAEARATTTEPSERALPFNLSLKRAAADALQTSTVTSFGCVLHRQEGHDAKTPVYGADGTVPPQEPALRVPDVPRVLSAVTPPLLGMDSVTSTSADAAIVPSTRVVLRLVPETASNNAPALELLFDAAPLVDEGATPVLASVRAITATSICDTLFPTQAVDARTVQQQFYELLPLLRGGGIGYKAMYDAMSQSLPPLKTFLEQSNLLLHRNGRFIATPLRLPGLGVPRRMLDTADGNNDATADEPVYIDYMFAGAEVRRSVATAFQGWTLALTNVQTGPGQGRWTELSLEAVPAGRGTRTKDSFRQAVGAVVHGNTIQWQMPVGAVLC